MGTKNNPGKFDCYANAAPDEEMFVLLARDKHAPTLVWLWATLRELDEEDPAKVKEARECAILMMQWAKENGRQSVGLGQATMAGMVELIRTVNGAIKELGKHPHNQAAPIEMVRRFLAATEFESCLSGCRPQELDHD